MFKTATDLLTTIFMIALAAFLVKNYKGTAAVGGTITDFVRGTTRAITFQG